MPYEPLRDVMHRTMENLRFVERHAGSQGPFEVTQLINSFLGALAHPGERYKDELSSISLAEAERLGWPLINNERPSDQIPTSLGDQLRLMRNALAHGNIAFHPGSDGEIRALQLWNMNQGRRTWGTVICE